MELIDFDFDKSKSYEKDGRNILNLVDFHVEPGRTIALVGPTGAGKTTIINLLSRFYDVAEGSVTIDGHDVRSVTLESLRRQMGVMLQDTFIFSGNVRENIRYGKLDATDEEIRHACQLAQADGFIQEFPDKYDTYIEQGGTNVSGGQRQRLCIARALLKKPKILILDDSTSAVDTKTDKLIREAFHNEIPDTTKIIIAQRVASVQESDMILVMDHGRIMAAGTHEQLLENCDEYRSIYESQTKNQAQPEELQ